MSPSHIDQELAIHGTDSSSAGAAAALTAASPTPSGLSGTCRCTGCSCPSSCPASTQSSSHCTCFSMRERMGCTAGASPTSACSLTPSCWSSWMCRSKLSLSLAARPRALGERTFLPNPSREACSFVQMPQSPGDVAGSGCSNIPPRKAPLFSPPTLPELRTSPSRFIALWLSSYAVPQRELAFPIP